MIRLTGWVAAARLGGATKGGSNRNNVIGKNRGANNDNPTNNNTD